MVPDSGNDPLTLALSRRCSTTELRGQYINNCMSNRNTELIEYLLRIGKRRTFNSAQEQLAWERGYLTGLLSSLMDADSLVKSTVIKQINKKR